MDKLMLAKKMTDILGKYKYVIMVFIIGVILMLLPVSKNTSHEKVVITESEANILSVEDQLSHILSDVKGAGKVQVMLSIAYGEEILYQTNENHSSDADRFSNSKSTVTTTDASRNQTGLIRQINPPIYSGAIIVCEGADNPTVKFVITEAVAKFTGLGTDKISILKMK